MSFLPSAIQIFVALVILCRTEATNTTITPPTDQGACEDEWVFRQGFCYWSSSFNRGAYRMKSWFGAERECRRKRADLVSIHSESENNFVHKMTHCARTWTGLTVTDNGKRTRPEGNEWIDGTSRTYLNWYPGQPGADSNHRYNCYYQHDSTGGKWSHALCTAHRFYYVCKKPAEMANIRAAAFSHRMRAKRAAEKCGKGWKLAGNDKCLHVNNTRVDFFEALLQCQSLGSHLVTMHNAQEEAQLSRAFDSCDTPWIGLENTDPNRVNSNAGWKWNDNTVLRYSNWQSTTPTNDKTKQCGKLVRGLSWVNTHCWELLPFICQKNI
ncbi:lymphocyte antigen 75-like [Clytia hemisphaerica]|uniref:C-type lectin domain-containing protein n=1 Tax=Clytia hemisphaerica TaxID=252671 RepID=A0A7M6DR61_9CNID